MRAFLCPLENSPAFTYFLDYFLRMMSLMSKSSDILDEITTTNRDVPSGKTVEFSGREIIKHDLAGIARAEW